MSVATINNHWCYYARTSILVREHVTLMPKNVYSWELCHRAALRGVCGLHAKVDSARRIGSQSSRQASDQERERTLSFPLQCRGSYVYTSLPDYSYTHTHTHTSKCDFKYILLPDIFVNDFSTFSVQTPRTQLVGSRTLACNLLHRP